MSATPPPTVPPTTPPPPGGGSYTPPPPPPAGVGGSPNSDRTVMLVLSYLGLLALIPYFIKKDDAEVQWHSKQGVTLLFVEIAWCVFQIGTAFLHVPMLGCITGVVGCVVWLGFFALSIVAIVKAVNGQRYPIPLIADLATKW